MNDIATQAPAEQFNLLVQTVHALASWRGEVQAMADIIAMLNEWDPSEVVQVLAAAALTESRRIDVEEADLERDNC